MSLSLGGQMLCASQAGIDFHHGLLGRISRARRWPLWSLLSAISAAGDFGPVRLHAVRAASTSVGRVTHNHHEARNGYEPTPHGIGCEEEFLQRHGAQEWFRVFITEDHKTQFPTSVQP